MPELARARSRWLAPLGRTLLRLSGWRVDGVVPELDHFVIIGVPHTSNWDGVVFLSCRAIDGRPVYFLSKQSLFWWPLGPVLRRLGGVPIDRSNPAGLVEGLVQRFQTSDSFILAIAPEGSRRRRDHWRSGFYRIAVAAGVPVVVAAMNHRTRVVSMSPPIPLTGDVRADMDRIRAFAEPRMAGRYPAQAGPARLREEDEEAGV